jgi:uncharacterized protein (DUF2252 family)
MTADPTVAAGALAPGGDGTAEAAGKQVRRLVPRRSQGQWKLRTTADRDPVEILQAQAANRVPELVPIRYGRMLVSPFTFYRGAAALMADDLATLPRTPLIAQLAGDAHLSNFGGFASPEREIVFDLNDFDETLPGPVEWDLKRLVASFAIAGRDRQFKRVFRRRLMTSVTRSYRQAMLEFAGMPRMAVWYAKLTSRDLEERFAAELGDDQLATFRRSIEKARKKTSSKAFSRYSELGPDGRLRVVSQPPLVVPLEEVFAGAELELARAAVTQSVENYLATLPEDRRHLVEAYRPVGVARKVVGVGSVGTRCWIILMLAENDRLDDLVLQVKEANASVLEPYLGASRYAAHGRRVVEGQRLMQTVSDSLLGWSGFTAPDGADRDFYVRQMWDGKVSADLTTMTPQAYQVYAQICGWTLARAHARSGSRKAIAGYVGRSNVLDDALADFGEAYADQNEADYALLRGAVDDGLIVAADG